MTNLTQPPKKAKRHSKFVYEQLDYAAIIERYKNGESFVAIAKSLQLGVDSLRGRCKQLYPEVFQGIRSVKRMGLYQRRQILDLRAAGMTYLQIAKLTGYGFNTVAKTIEKGLTPKQRKLTNTASRIYKEGLSLKKV